MDGNDFNHQMKGKTGLLNDFQLRKLVDIT